MGQSATTDPNLLSFSQQPIIRCWSRPKPLLGGHSVLERASTNCSTQSVGRGSLAVVHTSSLAGKQCKSLTRKSLARSCGMAPANLTLPSSPSVLIIC